jgi:hypothetical protein
MIIDSGHASSFQDDRYRILGTRIIIAGRKKEIVYVLELNSHILKHEESCVDKYSCMFKNIIKKYCNTDFTGGKYVKTHDNIRINGRSSYKQPYCDT